MIFFFLLLICVVITTVVFLSIFAPEKLPWYRPHLLLEPSFFERSSVGSMRHKPVITEGLGISDEEISRKDEKIQRLEGILLEKNGTIEKLQKQLNAEKSHRTEFEKIKELLDQEIVKLRTQIKEIKGE